MTSEDDQPDHTVDFVMASGSDAIGLHNFPAHRSNIPNLIRGEPDVRQGEEKGARVNRNV